MTLPSAPEGVDDKINIGSIFLRRDGRWEGRLYVLGKQRTVGCSKDRKSVEARMRYAITHLAELTRQTKKKEKQKEKVKMTHDAIRDYVWSRPEGSSAFRNSEIVFRLHVKPFLPDKPLKELTADDIEQLLGCLSKPRTREDVYKLIHASLEKAFRRQLVSLNVCDLVDRPKVVRTEGKALSRTERAKFLELIRGTRYEDTLLFLLYTGCRASERLTVRGQDVDLVQGLIYIRGTKTQGSKRIVPILDALRPILSRLTLESDKLIYDAPQEAVKTFLRRLPLTVSTKDLRTTYGTMLAEAGVPISLVQKWLGHTNVRTTSKFYVKILSDYEREQADLFKGIKP